MTGMDFDLAIVGGGPAGLACAARAADHGLSVLLCEPQTGAFDKPCGEGIMPEGARVLRTLGVNGTTSRNFPGVRYYTGVERPLELDFAQPGEAWWRGDLHLALQAAVLRRASIQQLACRVESAQIPTGGFLLRSESGDCTARWLAGADGASGSSAPWLRRSSGRCAAAWRRMGARSRFEERSRLDRVEIHFGGGVDVYLTPLPRGAINVVVLSDVSASDLPNARTFLEQGLSLHPRARQHLGAEIGRAETRALDLPWPHRVTDGNSFLLGDAGGALDPIIGAGVAVALRSGMHAADCVLARKQGMAQRAVARQFLSMSRAERSRRALLARGLRFASRHDQIARGLARCLVALPSMANTLGRIASGSRTTSEFVPTSEI